MLRPMLACSTIPQHDDIQYPVLASPKLDGIRCIMVDGKAYSRNGKLIPNKYIQQTLSSLDLPVFDGELMIAGKDFNQVQSAVMSEQGKPEFVYHVFDWVGLEPFHRRLKKAKHLLCTEYVDNPHLTSVIHTRIESPSALSDLYSAYTSLGYEGVIVRAIDGPYKHGRSTLRQGYMLKLKPVNDAEAIICGFEELMRNLDTSCKKQENLVASGMLGAFIVQWRGKKFKVGSGFNEQERKFYWQNKDAYMGKPVTFKYQELSSFGVPRFPIYKGIREEFAQ